MPKFLICERIYLRALEREDLKFCVEWLNDPEVRHFTFPEELPFNKVKGEEWFEKNNRDNIFSFGICLKNSQQK